MLEVSEKVLISGILICWCPREGQEVLKAGVSHLRDEQSAHARAGAPSKGVAELEALEAVAACKSPRPRAV